jgi:hypothetical protein
MYRRSQWEPEVSLGEAFEALGQAVESVRSAEHKLWVLTQMSNDPAHRSLTEDLDQIAIATLGAYNELVRDPAMPFRGEKAIAEYCRRLGYSEDVVKGGIEYLVRWWERVVEAVESGYLGILDEYINDLSARRIIHEIWPLTSAEQQIRFGPRLEKADALFEASTETVEKSFSLGVRRRPDRYPPMIRWLYYRVPENKDSEWYW